MPSPLGVGCCAYVFVGAWSYLVAISCDPRFFFELNGCYLEEVIYV